MAVEVSVGYVRWVGARVGGARCARGAGWEEIEDRGEWDGRAMRGSGIRGLILHADRREEYGP
jgi:hypothetical protein